LSGRRGHDGAAVKKSTEREHLISILRHGLLSPPILLERRFLVWATHACCSIQRDSQVFNIPEPDEPHKRCDVQALFPQKTAKIKGIPINSDMLRTRESTPSVIPTHVKMEPLDALQLEIALENWKDGERFTVRFGFDRPRLHTDPGPGGSGYVPAQGMCTTAFGSKERPSNNERIQTP
jgi:hypothetical protein